MQYKTYTFIGRVSAPPFAAELKAGMFTLCWWFPADCMDEVISEFHKFPCAPVRKYAFHALKSGVSL